MKLAIFGATGKSGKYLLDEALKREHSLKLLVRTPDKLAPEVLSKCEVIKGDVLTYPDVLQTVAGTDAVLVTIGHTKNSPADLQARALHNIITAMQAAGVRRLINLTGGGVPTNEDTPKLLDVITTKLLGIVDRARLQDGHAHVEVIRSSENIDWTVVRTGVQISKTASTGYKVGYVGAGKTGFSVSRNNIADFMLDILSAEEYFGKMPYVSD